MLVLTKQAGANGDHAAGARSGFFIRVENEPPDGGTEVIFSPDGPVALGFHLLLLSGRLIGGALVGLVPSHHRSV